MLSVAQGPAWDTSGKWMAPICMWTKALPEDRPNQKQEQGQVNLSKLKP